jgi:hypothetical protein
VCAFYILLYYVIIAVSSKYSGREGKNSHRRLQETNRCQEFSLGVNFNPQFTVAMLFYCTVEVIDDDDDDSDGEGSFYKQVFKIFLQFKFSVHHCILPSQLNSTTHVFFVSQAFGSKASFNLGGY